MKLSWRDAATTALAIFGGAVVYAKLYDLSWWVISDSWRSAIAVLGITGLIMALVSGFDYLNQSLLNLAEMFLGVVGVVIAVTGIFIASPILFYVLAGIVGVLWLTEVSRHAWNSIGEDTTSTYGRHAAAR